MILGAVLAGGASRRFGSDKALALVDGRALIDHVIAALAPQCDALVIVGRRHGDWPGLIDRPPGGAGPLAALNAALHYAAANGYAAVLSAPCDTLGLPQDLAALLSPGPAIIADQPVIGLWPATLAPTLETWLAKGGRSVHRFAAAVGAKAIATSTRMANINTPNDLARLD